MLPSRQWPRERDHPLERGRYLHQPQQAFKFDRPHGSSAEASGGSAEQGADSGAGKQTSDSLCSTPTGNGSRLGAQRHAAWFTSGLTQGRIGGEGMMPDATPWRDGGGGHVRLRQPI